VSFLYALPIAHSLGRALIISIMPKGIKGFQKGCVCPNTGRTRFKKGHTTWNKGKRCPQIAKAQLGKKNSMFGRKGEKSPSWKNGATPKNKLIRCSVEFIHWREKVFERDNYTCWICKLKGYLHPHHLKRFSDYPKLRFKISNGLTLCEFCHKTYTKFGRSMS